MAVHKELRILFTKLNGVLLYAIEFILFPENSRARDTITFGNKVIAISHIMKGFFYLLILGLDINFTPAKDVRVHFLNMLLHKTKPIIPLQILLGYFRKGI